MIKLTGAWRNIKIGWKFSFSVFICILLFAISTMVTFAQLNGLNDQLSKMDQLSSSAGKMTEIGSIFLAMDSAIADYIIHPTEENKEAYLEIRKTLLQAGEDSKKEFNDAVETALFLKLIQNDKMLNDLFYITVIPAVEQKNTQVLSGVRERTKVLSDETIAALDELREMKMKERNDSVNESREYMAQIAFTLIAALIGSIVISAAVTLLIQKLIMMHIKRVIDFSKEVAAGNLSSPDMEYGGRDEIGQLTASQNNLKNKMNVMVMHIKAASQELQARSAELNKASSEVNEGSQHVSATMQELAAGSSAQSHASSDIAAQMEDFSNQIEKANEEGSSVRQSSEQVLQLVASGSHQMESSVIHMEEIMKVMDSSAREVLILEEKTNEIGSLVTVIEQIADQTNLLALNAAIEAARVGEHGRGFAVVADEVRKLAIGVTSSITDITKIVDEFKNLSKHVAKTLGSGQIRVKDSTHSIHLTGQSFQQISQSIQQLDKRIENVGGHVNRIADGMTLVNRAVEEVAAVSEESAAGIEEVSASVHQSSVSIRDVADSSKMLKDLSDDLAKLVGAFRI
ncbi:methyl-accepting chemotaxis protein [Metabacillus idriensis]|uniref:methyl-accepting chemotaxis protein n=1 Tax=Metabacillus idriensis TaxID=324768 RepID=UPI00281464D6|nr:methyl-accepting chemotaxis protein [Metabacillus idriensis]MDR0137023.1 methyl-accepting chemotaxis protein [Metabacillus idriensis]